MYEFSAPILYNVEDVNYIEELNNKLTKSKIIMLYNCMPSNTEGLTGLEQARGVYNYDIKDVDDYCKFVKYVVKKGFKFVYLINTTRNLDFLNEENLKNLDILVEKLKEVGCNSFRVGNTANIQYLIDKFPDIDVRTSTTLAYNNINQYINLKDTYPQISEFCLHYENNHDFKLLRNLVKTFPNVIKEVLANEICIKGCPFRNSHYNFLNSRINSKQNNINMLCFFNNCFNIVNKDIWEYICKSNIIYPWNIEKYAKIGINNFKLAGRGRYQNTNFIYNYLKAIEDEDYMMNMDIFSLFENASYEWKRHKNLPEIKIKDIINYLPKIDYFIENGYKCNSVCKYECSYCYNLANTLNDKFPLGNYLS